MYAQWQERSVRVSGVGPDGGLALVGLLCAEHGVNNMFTAQEWWRYKSKAITSISLNLQKHPQTVLGGAEGGGVPD